MQIPFFRYGHVFTEQREEIEVAMQACLERGAFILQEELEQFEDRVAKFVGAEHAVGVANGTDSLMLALRAAGVRDGDEVIMASHTYVATAGAVHFVGGVPVLVDCGIDRMIDPKAVEAAISPRTRFIMPTQLNGRTADMDSLQDIASRHGLVIIEDAAQALGSRFKGRAAGTFGFAGSISLYPAKVLGGFGDGGLLLTNSAETASHLRMLRDHGRDEHGEVRMWGLNSRLDNLHAAVLLVKLGRYEDHINKRREIAGVYENGLSGISDLGLPPGPDSDPDHFDVYQNYEVDSGQRDALRKHLAEAGVGTIIQWAGTPLHRIESLGLSSEGLTFTEKFFDRCFLLPMNTSITIEEAGFIVDAIKKFHS